MDLFRLFDAVGPLVNLPGSFTYQYIPLAEYATLTQIRLMPTVQKDLITWALDSAQVGLLVLAESGQIQLVNQYALDLFSLQSRDVLGKTYHCLLAEPDGAATNLNKLNGHPDFEGISEGFPVVYGLKKDGTRFPLELRPRQQDHQTVVVCRDVSIRHRERQKLRSMMKVQQLWSALIENSTDFIGIANEHGQPIYANPAARQMVGLPPDFPIEKTEIQEYYPPDQRDFAKDVILKTMLEKGHWSGETTFRHWQTEKPIPVSDTHFLIKDPRSGELIGMGTITRDISDRKTKEKEIRAPSEIILGLTKVLLNDPTLKAEHSELIERISESARQLMQLVDKGLSS